MNSATKHIVIIGAGIGGTTLAARLSKLGYKVTVLEQGSSVGGRCSSLVSKEGHRWDQGPSLYLMPEIFEQAFNDLGENVKDHLKLKLCSPAYTVHYDDGNKLTLSSDLSSMGPQLEKFERPLGNKNPIGSFLSFLKESGQHYEESIKHVLLSDWSVSPFKIIARFDLYPMLIKTKALHVYTSLYSRAKHYFRSQHFRQAMSFSSMYMGMSPFHAPATYSLLQYAEYAKGVFYPVGGFQGVVEAFRNVAEKKFGATFRFEVEVKRILVGKDSAKGVELVNGEVIEADVVVSNADLVSTYQKMLPHTSYTTKLQKKEQTCSSISFYWSLSKKVPQLNCHNIFLASSAYSESFDEIFQKGSLPSQPSFYVNVPSSIDPSAAPERKDNLVILVPCGPIGTKDKNGVAESREAFKEIRDRARRQVLETLKARLGVDIGSLIDHEIINDPFDWEEKFNLFRGSILGLSHTIPQVLYLRPSIKHSTFKNLFFVGASTQPGTGVPVIVAGSKVVSNRIHRFLQGEETWLDNDDVGFNLKVLLFFITILVGLLAVGFGLLHRE